MTPLVAWTLALLAAVPAVEDISSILGRKVLRKASVSIAVADAQTGELIVARAVDEPRAPASNLKLLTSAAALQGLGADHHFETRLLARERPLDGVLAGDLVLVGSGDPCLRLDALDYLDLSDPAGRLADLLVDGGLRDVQGALVLDDGLFDREWVHPDWERADLDRDYAAPVSALSLYGNCLTLVTDGRGSGSRPPLTLDPPVPGYTLDNRLRWGAAKSKVTIHVGRPDDAGRLTVQGEIPRGTSPIEPVHVPVRDAPLLFGRALQGALAARGVKVREGLARDAGAGATLEGAIELANFRTHIDTALLLCNKESDNSVADHLLKALGAEVVDEGSFAGGGRAIERFLAQEVGTKTGGLHVADGSGLAPSNRVTARMLVDTLVAMNRSAPPVRDVFLRSLAVAGEDGSLNARLEDAPYAGAVRAKSGFIRHVSALSGYLVARSGRVLAFSILFNDTPQYVNSQLKAAQDDICRSLIDRH
jgi:D-alanyl-D-alanine carboxypeptidase/D-alanyl-D-alanine-endopeptidase (penicillin-binding protein 4)